MKIKRQSILYFFSLLLVLGSCGFGDAAKDAEKYADQFFKHLKTEDYNAIGKMIDEEGLAANSMDEWMSVLEGKEVCGKLQKVKKKMGFNTSIKNGTTFVSLKYKTTYTDCELHEKLVLVERGKEYKVYRYEYNEDPSKISSDN